MTGDETRGWEPPFDDRTKRAYFLAANRNKLGVAADLTSTRPGYDFVVQAESGWMSITGARALASYGQRPNGIS